MIIHLVVEEAARSAAARLVAARLGEASWEEVVRAMAVKAAVARAAVEMAPQYGFMGLALDDFKRERTDSVNEIGQDPH